MKVLWHWIVVPRSIPTAALVLAMACRAGAQPAPAAGTPPVPPGCRVLSYDDGESNGSRSIAGGTQMIRFEKPAGDWSLTQVWLYGSRYGSGIAPAENFGLYVCDEQMGVLKEHKRAYSTFERGEPKWVAMPLEPVLLSDKFYLMIDFRAEPTKGVYVHFDTSVAEAHSWVGEWGGDSHPMQDVSDWMIRAVIAPGTPDSLQSPTIPPTQQPFPETAPAAVAASGDNVLLKYDDGMPDGQSSIAGGGHAVLFTRPEGNWQLSQVHLYGCRYGSTQVPRENFTIYVCDQDFNIIKQYARPYATFKFANKQWHDIALEPVQVPDQFYVCFAFNPTREKGIFVCYDKSGTQCHSNIGVPGGRLGATRDNAEWMIRATLTRAP